MRQREREHEQGRVRERGRHGIWNRLQALSCQHRARRGAWTHRPRDHDLSRSRTPNRLSHPGTPGTICKRRGKNPHPGLMRAMHLMVVGIRTGVSHPEQKLSVSVLLGTQPAPLGIVWVSLARRASPPAPGPPPSGTAHEDSPLTCSSFLFLFFWGYMNSFSIPLQLINWPFDDITLY